MHSSATTRPRCNAQGRPNNTGDGVVPAVQINMRVAIFVPSSEFPRPGTELFLRVATEAFSQLGQDHFAGIAQRAIEAAAATATPTISATHV